MKIKIENLGIIKKAELELGKLTIICGENNTGKTYVTYALYGFLEKWHELMEIETPEKDIVTLMEKGTVDIDISPYIKKASDILKDCCNKYSKNLASVFASSEKYFESSQFSMDLDSSEIKTEENYDTNISSSKTTIFKISKGAGKSHIQITLLTEKENIDLPNFIIGETISSSIKTVAFSHTLPRPFIASAERTGAAIFQKELDILKNRMLENIHGSKAIKPLELVLDTIKGYDYDYALPVKDNVDFVRNLSEISKKESF
ncbi:MAG: ATP-binding protein, partial [Firmicutes bacterium]|nr:ATP-binding protein [Bacillota bacterium]